jgi:ATP adenylyltransferase
MYPQLVMSIPSQQPPRSDAAPTDPVAPTLHAPWRLAYLESLSEKEKKSGVPTSGSGSFLRDYWLVPQDDAKNHVILRNANGIVLLNAFPYANGHLLIALGEPSPRLLDYSAAQRAAFWELVEIATDLMERALCPQGINFGINQGRAAGAGVPQHLHAHLVPRWGGDTNFIQTVGQVRVIPSSLEAMYERYRRVIG